MAKEGDAEAVLELFAREADARPGRPDDHADLLQGKLDELGEAEARDEDCIIAALGGEVSFTSVASAMTVANTMRALAVGEVTIRASTDLNGWPPGPPEGADAAEWQHVLWRGLGIPVRRGPLTRQPSWWPSTTMPQQPTAENGTVSPKSSDRNS
jgi:hypothetical protein